MVSTQHAPTKARPATFDQIVKSLWLPHRAMSLGTTIAVLNAVDRKNTESNPDAKDGDHPMASVR